MRARTLHAVAMRRRARYLTALLALFLSSLVTRTASDDLHGVCAEGECTELPASETCVSVHSGDSYRQHYARELIRDPPKCDIGNRNCSKYQCSSESCQHTSQELWPHLNITLEHYNEPSYGIIISWEQPANVTGYVLLMTDTPVSAGNCEVTGYISCKCHHITNPSTTTYTQPRYYPDSTMQSQNLYIKLIPTPWCDGPTITMPIPESCHNIRPGDCDTCGYQNPLDVSPPINIQWTPLPLLHGVFLTWEPGESYYGLPYPNISFFIKVDQFEGKTFTPDITPRLEVLGRTNVTLQNLEYHVNYSVKIRAHDCGCGRRLDSSQVFVYLNESVPLPSSPTSLSPTLVVPPSFTTHLSTPSTTHIFTTHPSTSSTTHLSSHITLNSISSILPIISPAPHPTGMTATGMTATGMTATGMTAALTTLLTAMFVVITAGLAAVIVVVYRHTRKVRRRPSLSLNLPWLSSHAEPKRRTDSGQCLSSSTEESAKCLQAMPQTIRVLLLYSQETPEEEQHVILQLLVYELQKYYATKDGDRLQLEVVSYSSSTGQSSVPQWVENEVRDCDKVLCICNNEFKLEWEGKIRPLQGALVYCFKKLYLGTISRAEHKKYAIVLMDVAHEELIPSDYLKECKMFLCEKDAVKDIAQFVLEVPTYCLPKETHSLTPTTSTPTSTWESTDDGDCISLA